jgi:hypothetical protein
LAISIIGFQSDPDYAALIFVSLVGSVIMFRVGAIAADRFDSRDVWPAIIHGVSLVNAITIFLYVGVVIGFLDLSIIFDMVGRDSQLGYWRFALGNAIETPFVVTALLAAAIRLAPKEKTFLGGALLNFVTAGISESRIVVLIAFLVFFTQLKKSGMLPKSFALVSLGLAGYLLIDQVMPILESLGQRFMFSGSDYGSKDDRVALLSTALGSLSPYSLVIGAGLTGGAQLMSLEAGQYRTLESALLQIIVELGVVGLSLFSIALVAGLRVRLSLRSLLNPIALLSCAQILLFLPVHNQMPLTFAALGVLVTSVGRRQSRQAET